MVCSAHEESLGWGGPAYGVVDGGDEEEGETGEGVNGGA